MPVVHPQLAARAIAELFALAKAGPAELRCSNGGGHATDALMHQVKRAADRRSPEQGSRPSKLAGHDRDGVAIAANAVNAEPGMRAEFRPHAAA